jgi:hypothetical protein
MPLPLRAADFLPAVMTGSRDEVRYRTEPFMMLMAAWIVLALVHVTPAAVRARLV